MQIDKITGEHNPNFIYMETPRDAGMKAVAQVAKHEKVYYDDNGVVSQQIHASPDFCPSSDSGGFDADSSDPEVGLCRTTTRAATPTTELNTQMINEAEQLEGDGARVWAVFGNAGELLGVMTSPVDAAEVVKKIDGAHTQACVLNAI